MENMKCCFREYLWMRITEVYACAEKPRSGCKAAMNQGEVTVPEAELGDIMLICPCWILEDGPISAFF